MAIIKRPENTAAGELRAPEYIPGGDDYLKEYIDEINNESSKLSDVNFPDDSEFTELEEIEEQRAPSQYQQKRGQKTAQWAVDTVDKVVSSMVAVYAESDNVDDFRAEPVDIDDLADQLSVYFTENNIDLPPWVFALITFGFIMQKKFKGVGTMRKINIERKKFQVENESLKIQLELLTSKNTMLELRKKVEEMEKKAGEQ